MKQNNRKEKITQHDDISTDSFPNSKKVYIKGNLHNINVAMRDISVQDTLGNNSNNGSITVYDTSGPYTDPDIDIDVLLGLYPIREKWIKARKDVEELEYFTSEFSKQSAKNGNGITFKNLRKPLKARKGSNVTQMHYAKKGIITPEMEYIAIRENQRIKELKDQFTELAAYHPGESLK